MNSILLIGAGGHARACVDVLEQEGRFTITGLVGLAHEVGSQLFDYPVLGTNQDLPVLLNAQTSGLVTVGQIKMPNLRINLFNLLLKSGCNVPVIISPKAYVSLRASLGAGTIVMHGAVVNAGATIGRNCIINSQALIEHDVTIADHCHIATAAVINGGVYIGTGTFIGSNVSVKQCLSIGERCVIGMGQQVLTNCEAKTYLLPIKRDILF